MLPRVSIIVRIKVLRERLMLQNEPILSITLNYLTAIEPETYLVGGAVRNFLMGVPYTDIDITTKMRPEKIIECFKDEPVNVKGIKFGNVKVKIDRTELSLTTFRKDEYHKGHRYPSHIEFVDTLEEDLERRDFVLNTICYHSQKGIVDLLNGQRDLDRMLLVTVKDARISFQEDALRMIRALRFACEYDFDLSSDIQESILINYRLLRSISFLQIRIEITRLMRAPYYEKKRRQYPKQFRAISA